MQWVIDNYKILAAVAAGIALLYPSAGKAFSWLLTKVKSNKTVVNTEDLVTDYESEDLRCITHLRNRAAILGNSELSKEIKSVSSKFYDLHIIELVGSTKPPK